jgi:hypothetical protein
LLRLLVLVLPLAQELVDNSSDFYKIDRSSMGNQDKLQDLLRE